MKVVEKLLKAEPEFSVKEIARYLISHNSVPRESFMMKASELEFLLNCIRELERKLKEQGDVLIKVAEGLKDQMHY